MFNITEYFIKTEAAKMLKKLWDNLSGSKTYILAIAGVVYFLSAAATGHITWKDAVEGIWTSGLASTIRHGIGK